MRCAGCAALIARAALSVEADSLDRSVCPGRRSRYRGPGAWPGVRHCAGRVGHRREPAGGEQLIATFLIKQSGLKRTEAQTGAVTLIQRFGSAANLNIHLHCLVLDGVYRHTEHRPAFHAVRVPTVEELHALLAKIIRRLMRLLTRRGLLIEEHGEHTLAAIEADPALTSLQVASCTYRIALGPRAGHKVLSLHRLFTRSEPARRLAYGFSLHAGLRCSAEQRQELEQLCRYITRPAIANGRLSRNRTGDVVLRLKSPYQDGTTHAVMSPLECMQRFGGKTGPLRPV
jgi:hypothetical protein